MRKQLNIVFTILALIVLSASVLGASTSFGTQTFTANGTIKYVGQSNLGTQYTYTLSSLQWTDASHNDTACHEAFLLSTSTDGTTFTNGTWSDSGYLSTATNSTNSAASRTLTNTGIKSIRLYANATINGTTPQITVTTNTCSISGITVFYTGALEDTLGGLPNMGSDTGNFLSNLAPGIGIFILIISVFAGIVGIIGAIWYTVSKMFKHE